MLGSGYSNHVIYYQIDNSSHTEALEMLEESAMYNMTAKRSDNKTLFAPLYLLSTIVNDLGDEEVESDISDVCDYIIVNFMQ